MALKFLNKKGWHTGSLRNIENVWKAEQKHDAEQKKLEELRKQIHEERERSEFRQLQEQAGLVPRQERLEFLYDSGLAVGRTTDQGSFKALEATPKPSADAAESSAAKQAAAEAPGALFEEKPQSANDAWRKLHSDPLLLIRQREQEALARVKNNPVQMAMIRKSIESKSKKEKDKDLNKKDHKAKGRDKKEHKKSRDKKEQREKHHHNSSKHRKHSSSRQESDSEDDTGEEGKGRKSGDRSSDRDKHYHKRHADPESDSSERDGRSKKSHYNRGNDKEHSPKGRSDSRAMQDDGRDAIRKNPDKYSSEDRVDIDNSSKERENKRFYDSRSHNSSAAEHQHEARHKRRHVAPRLSEEERAARLREMQMDAEEHEEQRWKRLKKAEDDDAREAAIVKPSGGRNFLDAAHKSVYGAGKGGSATISESVRRRTHYLQGRSEANEGNAFRR